MRICRAVAFIVLLLATACSAPESGDVTGHSHNESWIEYRCTFYVKGTCTVHTPVKHPEKFCLSLRNGDDTGDRCFEDRSIWDRYPVGSHYPDAR